MNGNLSKKLKDTSISPSSSTENQVVTPKKKSKKKLKCTNSFSALPKLAEQEAKVNGDQIMKGELQSEVTDSKYRKFGVQKETNQNNFTKSDFEEEMRKKEHNSVLRWEFAVDDERKERERIEEYKRKRRERFYNHIGIDVPRTGSNDEKIDIDLVFA